MKLGTALLVLSAVIMSSCRSTRDVNVRIEVDSSAVYSPDSSAIYFVAHTAAWTKGKPFWFIMPVEGRSRYLYDNLYRMSLGAVSPGNLLTPAPADFRPVTGGRPFFFHFAFGLPEVVSGLLAGSLPALA